MSIMILIRELDTVIFKRNKHVYFSTIMNNILHDYLMKSFSIQLLSQQSLHAIFHMLATTRTCALKHAV